MSPATIHSLAIAIRVLGLTVAVVLLAVAVRWLQQARAGAYYVVREEARKRGLRLMALAVLLIPVTVGLAAYVDTFAVRPIVQVRSTATQTPHIAPTITLTSASTSTPESPTDTPLPRPTVTPLPTPSATATPTRIPPTDLPPTLLTPVPSAIPAAENASFGPIQLGSGFVNFQLVGIGDTFLLDTSVVHATFLVRNMNRNAVWTAAWYREGKYVAGDPLLWTSVPNTIGHVFGPGVKLRPGKWELRLYIEDRLQSNATFTILNITSTPTMTATLATTATATR